MSLGFGVAGCGDVGVALCRLPAAGGDAHEGVGELGRGV